MDVPLLDLTEQNLALEPGLQTAFTRVLHSGRYISGPEVAAFESAVAAYTGTSHAIALSSGTDALLVALMALEIGPGDEVICPTFTFFATAGCVARLGATPVLVDACPVCFNLRVEELEAAITPRTRAIIPVHLFGQCAEMDAVLDIARRHGLPVIEDAAQALGSRYRDRPAGSMGDCGVYSFFPSKNLGGFGEGGMLVTSSSEIAHRARLLRNHGMEPKYHHQIIGGNFRLDELQAALLAVKLPHLNAFAARRAENVAFYLRELARLPGVRQASPTDCGCLLDSAPTTDATLVLPVAYDHNHHIWNQFTLRVTGDRRDALRDHLQAHGIASESYYPVPIHRQPCFQSAEGTAPSVHKNADRLAREVLSIPVFPELKSDQKSFIVETIAAFL